LRLHRRLSLTTTRWVIWVSSWTSTRSSEALMRRVNSRKWKKSYSQRTNASRSFWERLSSLTEL
jgi:hypothetical protein